MSKKKIKSQSKLKKISAKNKDNKDIDKIDKIAKKATDLFSQGNFFKKQKQFDKAIVYYYKALQIYPDYPEAIWDFSILLLKQKDFINGWNAYEIRLNSKVKNYKAILPKIIVPRLNQEELSGKSLIIWPENGFGDEIMFARYFSLLKDRGVNNLIVVCKKPLKRLFETILDVDKVIAKDEWKPEFAKNIDFWQFIGSLPLYFKTDIDNIPSGLPYLKVSKQLEKYWASYLPKKGFRVGLVWKGSSVHKNDANRSLSSLKILYPLFDIKNISFISLQKNEGEDEAKKYALNQKFIHLGDKIKDFADNAAIVSQLDLVISVDTAIAHLTGALNKPCWVLLPNYETDWRWLLDRNDSPWYPDTMRLFRQKTDGNWKNTIVEIGNALKEKVQSKVIDSYKSLPSSNTKSNQLKTNDEFVLSTEDALEKQKIKVAPIKQKQDSIPFDLKFAINQGKNFFNQGKPEQALSFSKKALEKYPENVQLLSNVGGFAHAIGDLTTAESYFKKALKIKPDYADAHYNLGVLFQKQDNFEKAKESYLHAIKIRSDYVNAYYNLGEIFNSQNQFDKAKDAFHKAFKIQPEFWEALIKYIHQIDMMNSWDIPKDILKAFNDYLRKLKTNEIKALSSPTSFPLLSIIDDPYIHKLSSLLFGQKLSLETIRDLDVSKNPSKIKIAYLSADFHIHATAHLMAELFELHDKKQFETYAFSYGMKNEQTEIRKRLETSFDKFIDVSNISDDAIADMIQNYGIHIAIDLKGYTGNSRIGILASRPAPIQVQYLGYPGTLGLPYIDYMIADKIVIPKEQREHYTEKILFLPDTYQPNDRKRKIDPTTPKRIKEGLLKDDFIFTCFNNSYKIRAEQFDLWCDILKIVPESLLWLLESNQWSLKNLKKEIQKRDVDPERLIFCTENPS